MEEIMAYGKCFICGKYGYLERHHIFGGANRKKSEKYGLVVDLCGYECHREGPKSVHKCKETMQKLHEYGQLKFMEEHNATIEEFIKVWGKNYLRSDEIAQSSSINWPINEGSRA